MLQRACQETAALHQTTTAVRMPNAIITGETLTKSVQIFCSYSSPLFINCSKLGQALSNIVM